MANPRWRQAINYYNYNEGNITRIGKYFDSHHKKVFLNLELTHTDIIKIDFQHPDAIVRSKIINRLQRLGVAVFDETYSEDSYDEIEEDKRFFPTPCVRLLTEINYPQKEIFIKVLNEIYPLGNDFYCELNYMLRLNMFPNHDYLIHRLKHQIDNRLFKQAQERAMHTENSEIITTIGHYLIKLHYYQEALPYFEFLKTHNQPAAEQLVQLLQSLTEMPSNKQTFNMKRSPNIDLNKAWKSKSENSFTANMTKLNEDNKKLNNSVTLCTKNINQMSSRMEEMTNEFDAHAAHIHTRLNMLEAENHQVKHAKTEILTQLKTLENKITLLTEESKLQAETLQQLAEEINESKEKKRSSCFWRHS